MTVAEDDRQFEQLQGWWQTHGRAVLAGGCLALVMGLGWKGWQHHVLAAEQEASVLYQSLLDEALKADAAKVNNAEVVRLASVLKDQYAGSHYAQYARLLLARTAVEAGHLEEAASELQVVADRPADAALEEMARQRLARVLAARNEPQKGLALLEQSSDEAARGEREELKGDLLLQQGRQDEARAAYRQARQLQGQEATGVLQMKLDALAQPGEPADDA